MSRQIRFTVTIETDMPIDSPEVQDLASALLAQVDDNELDQINRFDFAVEEVND